MVDLNSDLILEVPDTPDQIGQAICQSSGPSSRRDIGKMDASPFRPRRILFKNRNNSITGQSSQGNLSSVSPAPLDAEHLFRQAALARLLSEDLDAKSSTPKSDTTIGPIENGKRAEKLDLKQSNSLSILSHANCKDTGGSSRSCQIREVDSSVQDASHKNADFLGVGSSLPTILTGRPRSKNGTSTSNRLKEVVCDDVCAGSRSSEDKGEVIYNKATGALSSAAQSVIPQRHVSQRKLVRNGCISPSNTAKRIVKTDKKQEVCSTSGVSDHSNPQVDVLEKGNVIDLTDSSPIITKQGKPVSDGLTSVDNMETRTAKKMKIVRVGERVIPQAADHVNSGFYSEGRSSGLSDKGKEIIHDGTGAKQTVEANLRRVCPSVVGDCSIVANSDSSVINSDEQGWRTTHNHTDKSPMFILGKTASIRGGESGSAWPSNQNQETAAGDNNNSISGETTILPARLEIRTPRVGRGKRKYGSSTYHAGGSSSSVGEPETSCYAYSNTMSDRRHTTCRHEIPIVEIDDICSPEVRPIGSRGHINVTSSGPNTTAQLESDELLARQLQEQLYNESPSVVPTEEIDAIIAMSLQHEEDAHQTSRTLRRYRNYTRGARSTRTSASQHATRAAYGTASSSISHMGNIAPIINMHLGAAVARFPSALQIHPNIDLNDYDALLALDENNHQHTGASESQINNLPQSVVQSSSTQEPCAVCLENPSVGDTIRHLPCFHKFHKECIDEWLRRKKLCPVCKSGIT